GFRVGLLVEPDDEGPAGPERRRPEPPGGPQEDLQQLRLGWPGRPEIHVTAVLPLATQISSTSLVTASAASPVIGDRRVSTCSTMLIFLFARNSCARAQ